jgi:two-component system, OmpR family, sensor histidine kinase KdpD
MHLFAGYVRSRSAHLGYPLHPQPIRKHRGVKSDTFALHVQRQCGNTYSYPSPSLSHAIGKVLVIELKKSPDLYRLLQLSHARHGPIAFVWTTLLVALAVGLGRLFAIATPLPNVPLIFLMGVLFAAIIFGMWPAIYASMLSFLAYNYFFIEPLYTLTVAEPHELFALVVFLLVAVLTSALAGSVRDQVHIAAGRTRAMRRLYEFTRKLSGLAQPNDIAEGAAAEIHASLGCPAVVLLPDGNELRLSSAWPPEDSLDAQTLAVAREVFDAPDTEATTAQANSGWIFTQLKTARRMVGVVGLMRNGPGTALDREARALLETLAEQTAAALERAEFGQELVRARTAAETERVRNTLLASISHDFRTPLASILGSATTLLGYRDKLSTAAEEELLGQIKLEAEHLDGMVRNLLAMARIDAGGLELRTDWIDIREITDRVTTAARRRGCSQSIEAALPADLPLIRADAILVEQALGNVIGNAIAHTQADAKITIDATVNSGQIVLHVADDGPGIPNDILPHVFEKFVRASAPASTTANGGEGTGLGLAIAKGIMEAHRGSIFAESPLGNSRGTRISMLFPRGENR